MAHKTSLNRGLAALQPTVYELCGLVSMRVPRTISILVLMLQIGFLSVGCSPTPGSEPTAMLISNVLIVDGTGAPGRRGAVRIVGDTIVEAGSEVGLEPGDTAIDGGGLVLAPGFIDTHSHHDWGLAETPDAPGAVSQGITTIVAGQDGSHPMPLAETTRSLSQRPSALNIAYYAGHGTLRSAVMGDDFRRAATAPEVDSMAALLRRELDSGALGLSSGLEYDPGIYSDPSEVLALAMITAEAGGRYLSHIRSEDRWFWDAVEEIVTIGREARLPVHISHIKLAMIPLWGQTARVLEILEEARAAGIDISADIYPYPYWQSTLTVLFPERNFEDRAEAEKILRELATPEGLLIGDFAPTPEYAGKTVAEISILRQEDPAATLMGLIRESQAWAASRETGAENGVVSSTVESVVATSMSDEDIAALMAWEHTNICSDGMLDGPHPRGFGAFPRVLGKYVREDRILGLEEAIRKMTSLPAAHMGLSRRGTISPGSFADLVLLDPATVGDRATPQEPQLLSTGIVRVWVNGETVWETDQTTGAHPGRVLRRQDQ